ncbi:hypothetical protein [Pseudalkalibacillus sp. SCS-8]|uniref:hypothetical protein n=1 Tax=Pseudalkalibacillus nanhaiensis TaxID=3115291 RepID=UPI0032DA5AB6
MKWKLRIPLFIFVCGLLSGIYQYFPSITLFQSNDFLRSMQFIGSIVVVFFLLEKLAINEKVVHASVGIAIIFAGVMIDYFLI